MFSFRLFISFYILIILGVTLACNLSTSDHIRGVVRDCAQTQYALRVLHSHGLNAVGLQAVFQSVAVSNASPRPRGAVLPQQQVNIATSVTPPDLMTFQQLLLEEADRQLFNRLCNNSDHYYHLRQRAHSIDIAVRTAT